MLEFLYVCVLGCALVFAQETELCPEVCTCLGNHVDCSSRKLLNLPQNIPSWTETLELQHNELSDVGPGFTTRLSNLQKLDLSSNLLQQVSPEFWNSVPALSTLNLRKNRLTVLPTGLDALQNLRRLDLRANTIAHIADSTLNQLSHVATIDLSRNRITEWPYVVFERPVRIENLYLDANRIAAFHPQVFNAFTSLRQLKLARNRLKHLQKESFGSLGNLTLLDLSRNRLRQIEGLTFKGLSSVRVLRLNKNGLRLMQDGTLWGMNSLQELYLHNNKLTQITKGMLYAGNVIKILDLSHNEIGLLDIESWNYCRSLEFVDLSRNRLEELPPKSFQPLSQLKELKLGHNRLEILNNDTFAGLGSLELLDLSNNRLFTPLQDSVRPFSPGFPSLKTLILSQNGLQSLPPFAFRGIDALTKLDLGANQFTTIDRTSFSGLESLEELSLNSSSLLCDCQLDWLSAWLIDQQLDKYIDELICDHPEQLRGLSVMEIDNQNMTCDDSPKPLITEQPTDIIGLRSHNVTFSCSALASKDAQIMVEWKKNTQTLYEDPGSVSITKSVQSSSSRDLSLVQSSLSLISLTLEDAGLYQCVVTNKYGAAYSHKAELTVHVYPSFGKRPMNLTLELGENARLECSASGSPQPRISWQKDGGDDFPAAKERRMHVLPQDDVFFIVNVKSSDAGLYTCAAKNPAGEVQAHASIVVLERPSFRRVLTDKRAQAGQTVVLECLADGAPQPEISWSFDSSPLPQSERYSLTAENQLLVIVKVRQSDAGLYTCTISNQLGQATQRATLTVLGEFDKALVLGNGTIIEPISPLPTPEVDADWFPFDPYSTVGVVIIVVIACVVVTSLVWVLLIYCRTRGHAAKQYAEVHKDEPEISAPQRVDVWNPTNSRRNNSGTVPNIDWHRNRAGPEPNIDFEQNLEATTSLDSGVQDVSSCPLMQISVSSGDWLSEARALNDWTENNNGELRTFKRRSPVDR